MSPRLRFTYDIGLQFDRPVGEHSFALRCIPPSLPTQRILSARLQLEPAADYSVQPDGFGNLVEYGFLSQPHVGFCYRVEGLAETNGEPEAGADHPMYHFASHYTAPSPESPAFLDGLHLTGSPWEMAERISDAVHDAMQYRPGSTGVHTTAAQAFAAGQGVCQDFAHVFLMLARQAGLSARYVNGLTVGEGASHAWCQVWQAGAWRGIDPTRRKWTDGQYLRFNAGRDFGDCPLERGLFRGIAMQTQSVHAVVTEE